MTLIWVFWIVSILLCVGLLARGFGKLGTLSHVSYEFHWHPLSSSLITNLRPQVKVLWIAFQVKFLKITHQILDAISRRVKMTHDKIYGKNMTIENPIAPSFFIKELKQSQGEDKGGVINDDNFQSK